MDPIPLTLLALCVGAIIGGFVSAAMSAPEVRRLDARVARLRDALHVIRTMDRGPAAESARNVLAADEAMEAADGR